MCWYPKQNKNEIYPIVHLLKMSCLSPFILSVGFSKISCMKKNPHKFFKQYILTNIIINVCCKFSYLQ